jgi:beta-catenin-like protein 1
VKTGSIGLLANLLSHENTDIAIDVIEVIQELTDEDVGAEVDDLAEEEEQDQAGGSGSGTGMAMKTRMAMGELIDELVSSVDVVEFKKLYLAGPSSAAISWAKFEYGC